MISCSHWGMFEEVEPRVLFIPAGWKLPDDCKAEWDKPGGIIQLERDEKYTPNYWRW